MERIEEFLQQLKEDSGTRDKQKAIYAACKYSASKIVEVMKPEFDKEGVAAKTFNKYFNDETSIYYHKSIEEIIKMWEEKGKIGMRNGTILDTFIGMILEKHLSDDVLEKYVSSLDEVPAAKCKTFKNFFETNIKDKLSFVAREKILADFSTGVQGRFDAMFMSGDKLLLVDWKNTENITTENPWKKMNGPLYKYDASELNGYTVQIYLYTYILRKVYNLTDIKIIPLIIQIGTTGHNIYVPVIPYSDKLVEDIIVYAIGEINKKTMNTQNV